MKPDEARSCNAMSGSPKISYTLNLSLNSPRVIAPWGVGVEIPYSQSLPKHEQFVSNRTLIYTEILYLNVASRQYDILVSVGGSSNLMFDDVATCIIYHHYHHIVNCLLVSNPFTLQILSEYF